MPDVVALAGKRKGAVAASVSASKPVKRAVSGRVYIQVGARQGGI